MFSILVKWSAAMSFLDPFIRYHLGLDGIVDISVSTSSRLCFTEQESKVSSYTWRPMMFNILLEHHILS